MDLELKLVGQTVGYIQVSEEDVLKIKSMPNIITRWDLKIIKEICIRTQIFLYFQRLFSLEFLFNSSVFSYESGELDGTYNILPPILYLVMSLEN